MARSESHCHRPTHTASSPYNGALSQFLFLVPNIKHFGIHKQAFVKCHSFLNTFQLFSQYRVNVVTSNPKIYRSH